MEDVNQLPACINLPANLSDVKVVVGERPDHKKLRKLKKMKKGKDNLIATENYMRISYFDDWF